MNMTWPQIVEKARAVGERFRVDGSIAWYRGHRCQEWSLKSSAHRHIERLTAEMSKPPDADGKRDLLRDVSKTLYQRFKAEAWPLLHERERSDWGVVFAMQHFAIPTRLLDWSENFACALFFAQWDRKREDSAAIWIADPQAINQASLNIEAILSLDDEPPGPEAQIDTRSWHPKWRPPAGLVTVAAAPIFSNPRMVAQQSAFFLTGESFETVDQQFPKLVADGRLVKLVLPPETFDDAEEFLALAGLTAFDYFPDLEGLARKHEQQVERTIRNTRKFYPEFFK